MTLSLCDLTVPKTVTEMSTTVSKILTYYLIQAYLLKR